MKKERVDILLVEKGLAESRSRAQRLVMAGQVRADGQVVDKSSAKFSPEVELTVDEGPPFVSRGGEKLAVIRRRAPWVDIAIDGGIDDTTIGPAAAHGANLFVAAALQRGPLGVVSVLSSLYPVVTAVAAVVILRERLTAPQIGGVVLAMIAVALLVV